VNPRQDKVLAKVCENCPVCHQARRKQRGFAYEFVKRVEGRICPFGRSYERVTGRKSHEPVTRQ
jgi:hypothetical protein